jgi:hypothetical protein
MEGAEAEGEGEDEDYFMLPTDHGDPVGRLSLDSIDEDGSSRSPSPSASFAYTGFGYTGFGTSAAALDSRSISPSHYPPGPSLSPKSASAAQTTGQQHSSRVYFSFAREHDHSGQTPKGRSALRTPRPGDYHPSDISSRSSQNSARRSVDGARLARPDDMSCRPEILARRSEDLGRRSEDSGSNTFWSRRDVVRPGENSVSEADGAAYMCGQKDKGKGKGKSTLVEREELEVNSMFFFSP